MPNYVYGVSIFQFLMGALIIALNVVLCLALIINPRLRTAPQCLLGNVWFSNLVLGVVALISSVVNSDTAYAFQKPQGTVAVINGFINAAMLLALVTSLVITMRNPNRTVSLQTAFKIIFGTWILVLSLTLIKAIVFNLHQMGVSGSCFDCFLIFEVTTLVCITVTTLLIFCGSLYLICVHRNRTVSDSSVDQANNRKEYELTLTVGCLLLAFSLTFLVFVLLIIVWLAAPTALDVGTVEIVITLFYAHCVINPIIAMVRDADLRSSALLVSRCQRQNAIGPQEPQVRSVDNVQLVPNATPTTGNGYRPQNEPSAPSAIDLAPVETPVDPAHVDGPGLTVKGNDSRPRYGSTDRAAPTGGVAFLMDNV